MGLQTAGIHHITAFVGNAQGNVDFYAGILGLRLVKRTVNFDAPQVYHFYFGNEVGSPGTIMTCFPFAGAQKGRVGGGQVGYVTFVVPLGALPFWEERLQTFSIPFRKVERFAETYLRFQDHDGLQLEIVERAAGEPSKWSFGKIPADKAIKGLGGAVLYSLAPEKTMHALTHVLGLQRIAAENGLVRFRAAGELGNLIDVHSTPLARGRDGAGTVHHIAWRAKDIADQQAWRNHVSNAGLHPTKIVDRHYFTSLYFREAGEILFEIATDLPGFQRDEPFAALGEKLMLPERFAPYREQLENILPPVEIRVLQEDLA
ncbi:ring-cleaving dioxygenase [Brevibacillus marinus]|uniref:ring-cleaving dioxygenase n=1 Tax=Brevibacillus marinus TaxID=2496837 RepID=UPI000F8468F2|nr:ring-cleaving dioxygenase [Brevibacillus marinus]